MLKKYYRKYYIIENEKTTKKEIQQVIKEYRRKGIKCCRRQKFVLKLRYEFSKFTYNDIVTFYQMVFISHFYAVNSYEHKTALRTHLDNYQDSLEKQYIYFTYRYNWYDVWEKYPLFKVYAMCFYFKRIDRPTYRNVVIFWTFSYLVKPLLAKIVKWWWLNENKNKKRWFIFLSRFWAVFFRVFIAYAPNRMIDDPPWYTKHWADKDKEKIRQKALREWKKILFKQDNWFSVWAINEANLVHGDDIYEEKYLYLVNKYKEMLIAKEGEHIRFFLNFVFDLLPHYKRKLNRSSKFRINVARTALDIDEYDICYNPMIY